MVQFIICYENWVHFPPTSPALKMQASGQISLSLEYAQITISLLGFEGLEHYGEACNVTYQKYLSLEFPIGIKYAIVFLQVLTISYQFLTLTTRG